MYVHIVYGETMQRALKRWTDRKFWHALPPSCRHLSFLSSTLVCVFIYCVCVCVSCEQEVCNNEQELAGLFRKTHQPIRCHRMKAKCQSDQKINNLQAYSSFSAQ